MSKYEYISCETNGEIYYFSAKEFDDEFLKNFKNDFNLKKNYKILQWAFTDELDFFAVHDREILTDDFICNFRAGMNNRWNSIEKRGVDPAIYPTFGGCIPNERDVRIIQKSLVFINKMYGKEGLDLSRQLNIAQSISMPLFCLLFYDPEDKYNFSYEEFCSDTKSMILDTNRYYYKKRIIDIFNSKVLTSYNNENVKSALISLPHLLYDDNDNILSEVQLFNLLEEISSRLGDNSQQELDYSTFRDCQDICEEIYLERNLDKHLKEKTNKKLVKKKF